MHQNKLIYRNYNESLNFFCKYCSHILYIHNYFKNFTSIFLYGNNDGLQWLTTLRYISGKMCIH